ncbi:hypothetical protein GCM10009798_04210 [Nocardioides panacihumi]|uniref:Uncharacterized protein n=1 Tax=Nocardioides panacihumi TaxID=400774 RepID=A0ABN2QBA4_9ACTN
MSGGRAESPVNRGLRNFSGVMHPRSSVLPWVVWRMGLVSGARSHVRTTRIHLGTQDERGAPLRPRVKRHA